MRFASILSVAVFLLHCTAANATSLRVAPARLDLVAPDSTSTLNLRNEGDRPLNVQIRIFRWSQEEGEESLEPTTDVVASPPMATLPPGVDYVVRVVRVSPSPVTGEESYRLLVDELPDAVGQVPGTVNVVVRYSIPVFFTDRDADRPHLSWSAQQSGGTVTLTARNDGSRHLRISDLKLTDAGKAVAIRRGLVGYVLGGATMRWSLPRVKGGSISGRPLTLSAIGDVGAVNATVPIQSGR